MELERVELVDEYGISQEFTWTKIINGKKCFCKQMICDLDLTVSSGQFDFLIEAIVYSALKSFKIYEQNLEKGNEHD